MCQRCAESIINGGHAMGVMNATTSSRVAFSRSITHFLALFLYNILVGGRQRLLRFAY